MRSQAHATQNTVTCIYIRTVVRVALRTKKLLFTRQNRITTKHFYKQVSAKIETVLLVFCLNYFDFGYNLGNAYF